MTSDSDSLGNDRFRLIRKLGTGGMGVVYEAEDRERGARVALKALRHASADTLYRLKREFRALVELQHPNLVALHELFVGEETFFTMELVDGVDLLTYVRPSADGGAFDEARLRAVMAQLARGVIALHDAGKIHRDLKPSNVLVDPFGRVVIVDFGLVAHADVAEPESRVGEVVGTVAYMAPEQCRGDEALTPAVDWYGVGTILYEALTGRVPFLGPTVRVLVDKQQHAPPPPRAIVASVPKDLDELCAALLEREARDRPDGRATLRRLGADVRDTDGAKAAAAARNSATRTVTFAGRQTELAALRRGFDLTRARRSAAAVVRGPSGIGKSSLVAHFVDDVRRDHPDVVVLRGRCYERESVPYQAMDSLVDDLSHHLVRLPAADVASLLPLQAALLPRLFPVLGRVSAIATAPRPRESADPQELRSRALAALRELLRRLAEQRPLVVVLDDLHWVDASTLDLLVDLLGPPEPPTLFAILATRPEGSAALDRVMEQVATEASMIDLAPLSVEAATTLAAQLLGPDAARHAAEVAREAGGDPFFIGELVKYLQSSDAESGASSIPSSIPSSTAASIPSSIPSSIATVRLDDLVVRRISKLSSAGKRTLDLVALSNEPIARRTLAAAAEVSGEALTRELGALRALHFVRAAGGAGDERVETFHARVRDAVLDQMSPPARRAHHARLAWALAQWGEGDLEAQALHWSAAGDPVRASEHALRAADEALSHLRFERAADLFQWVLDMGAQDAGERRRLQRRIGDAMSSAGRPRDAAAALLKSADSDDPLDRLEFRRRAAEELLRGGYVEEGLAAVATVLDEMRIRFSKTPQRALVSLLLLRAWLAIRGLRFRERQASELAPTVLTKIDVCWSVAVGLAAVDHLRGSDGQARHLALALDAGEPTRVARALAVEACFLASTGSAARARKIILVCRALAERIGSDYVTSFASFAEGFVAYFCDSQWRRGAERLEASEALFRRKLAGGWEIDTSSFFACLCQLYRGELAVLARRVPELVREAERRGDLYQSVNLRTRLNTLWLFRDEPERAERELDAAIAAWPSSSFQAQHFYVLSSRCDLALYRGDAALAARTLARDQSALARSLLPRVTLVRIEVAGLRARIALAQAIASTSAAERTRCVKLAQSLARALHRERVPIARALSALVRAGAFAAEGDHERSAAELRRALLDFEDLESALYAAVARRRLGETTAGEAGRALVAAADAWFDQQRVRNPTRVTDLLAPGWSSAR